MTPTHAIHSWARLPLPGPLSWAAAFLKRIQTRLLPWSNDSMTTKNLDAPKPKEFSSFWRCIWCFIQVQLLGPGSLNPNCHCPLPKTKTINTGWAFQPRVESTALHRGKVWFAHHWQKDGSPPSSALMTVE